MRVLITVFLILLIFHQVQYHKLKKKIESTKDYSQVYLRFIKAFLVYQELKLNNKLINLPISRKKLEKALTGLDVLMKSSSFKEIICCQIPKSDRRKKINEIELFIKEKENFTPEIDNLFKEISEIYRIMLKSTNSFLYFMYQYDIKIKRPLLLKIISILIFILERVLIFLYKRNISGSDSVEYMKKMKEYKSFKECII